MAEPFHLIGLPWQEAEPRLGAHGLMYDTALTGPPGRPPGLGDLRVVGVRTAWVDARLLIILAREDSGARPAGQPPAGGS